MRTVMFQVAGAGVQARCRTRDAGGALRRPSFSAPTEHAALAGLKRRVRELALRVDELESDRTLGGAIKLWLEDRKPEVRSQTLRIYADTARWLVPIVGAIPLEELQRPARIRHLLAEVERVRGPGAVASARTALSGAFGVAVDNGLTDTNPVRALRRRARESPIPTTLTVAQASVLRVCVRSREARTSKYVGPSAFVLGWVMELMLGSGLRISEALALRNMDVDWTRQRIAVSGTLVDDPQLGLVRQGELKGRHQARYVEVPRFAMTALLEARACRVAGANVPLAPAIQGRVQNVWCNPRNIRRSLRALRTDARLVEALAQTGLMPSDLTPHLFRRTAATLAATSSGDLSGAQQLLGHSDPRTTVRHYMGAPFRAVGSAVALEQALGPRPGVCSSA